MKVAASMLVLLLLLAATTLAEDRPIVAVFDIEFRDVNLSAKTREKLNDYLCLAWPEAMEVEMNQRGFGWAAAILAVLCASALLAEDKPIVAVFNVEVKGTKMDSGTIDRLTDYLGSLLAERGYQVVPRSQLRERLQQEKKGSYQQCYDQSCQIEIGKEMAAQKSLATQVLKIGSQCKVTLILFDLQRAASQGAGTASGGCGEDGVVVSMEKAVLNLLEGGPPVAPVKPAPAVEPPGPKAPDLSEYEKLAAAANAEEAKQKEADKKALEDRQQYLASLEKAWESVKKVAATKAMGQQARAGVVRKFLQDFAHDNTHDAEAKGWIASLDQGKEPGMGSDLVWVHSIPAGIDFTKSEVTVAQYRACVDAGKCSASGTGGSCNWNISGKEQHPVNCVDWRQARGYCEWAGKRLPTEGEWEKAARGGTTGARYGDLDQVAWYYKNSGKSTQPVGKTQPNAFGLFDMLGPVNEWCSDWYDEKYYQTSPGRDPTGPGTGRYRVLRGVRAFGRVEYSPDDEYDRIGFRCASSAAIGP